MILKTPHGKVDETKFEELGNSFDPEKIQRAIRGLENLNGNIYGMIENLEKLYKMTDIFYTHLK